MSSSLPPSFPPHFTAVKASGVNPQSGQLEGSGSCIAELHTRVAAVCDEQGARAHSYGLLSGRAGTLVGLCMWRA